MKKAVFIDLCLQCEGKWLDRGEINFFVKDPLLLVEYDAHGLNNKTPSEHLCPSCPNVTLDAGWIPNLPVQVEECPSCKGIFFDKNEMENISDPKYFVGFRPDKKVHNHRSPSLSASPALRKPSLRLPSLGFVSGVVLSGMYALLFALMVFAVEAGVINYSSGMLTILGFILFQFWFSPHLMDWSLQLFGSLDWVGPQGLPKHLQEFIVNLCKEKKLPYPQIGIIRDGSPQAYTYGRTPKSARVVISQGLIDILSPEELEAVVAHEMGHVKHWDFVVMTVAQLVPILFYHVYRVCWQSVKKRSGSDKEGGHPFILAASVIAYICYLISNYLVMFVSRLREYWADQFSVYHTKNPNSLIYALTKIGFGLVTHDAKEKIPDPDEHKKSAVQAMGIMNINGSKEIAMALQGDKGKVMDIQSIKEVMSWDLWSPWAAYYEIHSTHPLTAKRINAIASHGNALGVESDVVFDLERPESYWDDFFVDLIYLTLPIIVGLASAFLYTLTPYYFRDYHNMIYVGIVGFCTGGMVKTFRAYPPPPFLNTTVRALLKNIKVSPMRSYPVSIKGKVIGRGDAGNIFSEDMVLRDGTGIIFLDYQQPLAVFNFLFAIFKLKKFNGKEVTMTGWYRRAPVPYVEVKSIRSAELYTKAYTFHFKVAGWILLPVLVYFIKSFLTWN